MKHSLIKSLAAVSLLAGFNTVLAQDSPAPSGQVAPAAFVAPEVHDMDIRNSSATETLHIVVGRSTVLRGTVPLKRIYVGNPTVLQSFTAGPSEVVLTAKVPGVSSLVLWDSNGGSRLYTVTADLDPEALRQSLREAYPKSNIRVEGKEGRIYLSGTVATQEIADGAAKLAIPYSKEIVSSILIAHGKQVQLKLRIVEVDRTKMEQYGINFSGNPFGNTAPFSVTTGQFPSTTVTTPPTGTNPGTVAVSDALNLFLYSTKLNFGATVKALEQKQILQVLAEPTLVALSGQPARFLSGGEFPYPVAQGGAAGQAPTISISFRPYGVKVDFTPTVNEDGSIRLKVAPEVSTLDFANAVTISGFTIPALSTRRAETEVEIRDGQSFALSGLLDHRTIESLSQIPGISKIPFIGKAFISKSYTHSVVELVVMVTASVVDPLSQNVTLPEPGFIVPNLDNQTFDKDLSKEQKIEPKKP